MLGQLGGLFDESERCIGGADHAHQRRLHGRLAGKLELDAFGAEIQQLARADPLAEAALRCGALEQLGKEGRDFLGAPRLTLRAIPLGG